MFLAPHVDLCALAPQKCGTVYDLKVSCLIPMLIMHPCIHSGTLSLPTTVKIIFVFLVVESGCQGLLVSAEPRKMCAVAAKLRRVRRHMFFCALPGGFWVRPLSVKSANTLEGVAWCRRSWSGLAVQGEQTVLHRSRLSFSFDVCVVWECL